MAIADVIRHITPPRWPSSTRIENPSSSLRGNIYQLKSLTGKYRPNVAYGYQYSDAFTYDALGNMSKKAQSQDRLVWDNQNVTPTTDPVQAMNQLNGSRFDHNVTALSYTLDYTYANGRPHATSTVSETQPNQAPAPRPYNYDANGNNTGNTFKGTTRAQVWDEENRLKQVTVAGTSVARFRYNDEGERTKKQTVAGDSWYVNQYFVLLPNNLPTKHIFAGDTRVATKTDAIYMQAAALNFYHSDHLGSTSYLSAANQDLVQHERYFAFGELWRPGAEQEETDLGRPDSQRREWAFTSKEWDVDTGLYYFGARYFDPRTVVWQSPDPILASYMRGDGFGGVYTPSNLGLYTYARNNPVVLRDPDGTLAPLIVFGAMIAAGAGGGAIARVVHNLFGGRQVTEGVAASTIGGATQGALVAATAGTGIATQVVGGGLAAAAGGGVSRGIETGDPQMSAENMSVDFTVGATFSAAGVFMSRAPASIPTTTAAGERQSLAESARALVEQNGGANRVSIRHPNGRVNIDLAGASHDGVPTPHVQEFRNNIIPSGPRAGQVGSRSKVGETRPATAGDVRTARHFLGAQKR